MIKKNMNETDLEYIIRIIKGKLEDKTVDDDYSELSELVFGKRLSSDETRKRFYGMKFLIDLLESEDLSEIEDEEILNKIEKKKLELEKERKKIQTVKVEYHKMLREQARRELIVESLKDIIPRIETPKFKPLQVNLNKQEWVLTIADIHFDKFYESVNNKYSIDIFYNRMNLLLSKLVEEIKFRQIDHIHIVNLGDTFEGLLRISSLKTMRVGLIESVVMFCRFMSNWLNELSQYVNITYHHVNTANHSELRIFESPRGEIDENLERLVVNYIYDVLKDNDRIKVPLYENLVEFKLFNKYNVVCIHGHEIKNIEKALQDLSMLYRKFYDYVFLGHFHAGREITMYEGVDNNMEIIVAPSMVGSDTYSDSLFKGSKSSAKLFGFTDGEGKTDVKTFVLN